MVAKEEGGLGEEGGGGKGGVGQGEGGGGGRGRVGGGVTNLHGSQLHIQLLMGLKDI